VLELELNKILKLRSYPNYQIEELIETDDKGIEKKIMIITFVPPSISDASGLDNVDTEPKYIEIRGEVNEVTRKVKIVKAEINEGSRRRKLDETELQLWAEYVIGGE
jgi:hypothetical protein